MAEHEALAHFWRGWALLGAGHRVEAEADLLQAIDAARTIGRPYLLADTHQALANLCAEAGRSEDADRHRAATHAAFTQIQQPSPDMYARLAG